MPSAVVHNLNSIGLTHCGIVLGYAQFIYTFITCKNLQKELVIWLDMQQIHHLC